MDAEKIEVVASKIKGLGGAISGLSAGVALAQQLAGASPKAAIGCALAGIAIHGASTFCNEFSDFLEAVVAVFTPKPTDPSAPK